MRYYLDTNVAYNLKCLPEQVINVSYTSFLTVLEIVAGIDKRSYFRRRAALKGIVDRRLSVDWRTPDMVIFDSFAIYNEFLMSDSTVTALQDAMLKCINGDNYEQYAENKINDIDIVEYFAGIDRELTAKFNRSFPELIQSIKPSALVNTFTVGDLSIKVDFTEVIKAGFIDDNQHAMLVKNIAAGCQYIIMNSHAVDKPQFQIDDVIRSYNGGVDFFICGWLAYSLKNIGVANMPGRNDFQDLLHFIYLRNYLDKKIVSDDAIYSELAPQFWLPLKDLRN